MTEERLYDDIRPYRLLTVSVTTISPNKKALRAPQGFLREKNHGFIFLERNSTTGGRRLVDAGSVFSDAAVRHTARLFVLLDFTVQIQARKSGNARAYMDYPRHAAHAANHPVCVCPRTCLRHSGGVCRC